MTTMNINQLMKRNKGMEGKIMLQSSQAKLKKTFFTPYFYDPFKKQWHGLKRWYSSGHHKLHYATREANKGHWEFVRFVPMLPKQHLLRKELEKNRAKMEYRINLIKK